MKRGIGGAVLLASIVGVVSMMGGVSQAGASPPAASLVTGAATVVGQNTAEFHIPALNTGQTYSSSVQLPDGKIASVQLKVIEKTADWGNVFTWQANCGTIILPITYSWFHIYEGMSGNGSAVTNVASPNEYWSTSLGFGLETLTTPTRYITAGKGNMIVGATFGAGYGPLSSHNRYYWHLIVNGSGSVNSGSFASVNCNIIG